MKYLFSFLIVATLFSSPVSFAQVPLIEVYFDQTYDYTFTRNDPPREVSPILLIDQNGKSLKAAFGLRIIIPVELYTIWDETVTGVTAKGNSVQNGKIDAVLTPNYSENLKEVYLQVKADFAKDESVTIEGLRMRVYHIANDKRYIGLDLNGDRVSDVANFRWITISTTEIRTDRTAPSAIKEIKGNFDGTKTVFSWKDPKDMDLERVIITRTLKRDSKEETSSADAYPKDQQYTDLDSRIGDSIQYKFESRDSTGNLSEPVLVTISPVEAPSVSEKSPSPAISIPVPKEEKALEPVKEVIKKDPKVLAKERLKARQQKIRELKEKRKKLREEKRKALQEKRK